VAILYSSSFHMQKSTFKALCAAVDLSTDVDCLKRAESLAVEFVDSNEPALETTKEKVRALLNDCMLLFTSDEDVTTSIIGGWNRMLSEKERVNTEIRVQALLDYIKMRIEKLKIRKKGGVHFEVVTIEARRLLFREAALQVLFEGEFSPKELDTVARVYRTFVKRPEEVKGLGGLDIGEIPATFPQLRAYMMMEELSFEEPMDLVKYLPPE